MNKYIFTLVLFYLTQSFAEEFQFKSGDLIFQTSKSNQSYAIMWASKSIYSHVGIVDVEGKNSFVIEAISKVSRTPLKKWIQRGRLQRYSVFRMEKITEKDRRNIIKNAKVYLGTPYDIFFTSTNKEIYCSELVSKAFNDSGLSVGRFQKIKELNVDNAVVRSLVSKRWKTHPLCQKIASFDECWQKILNDELITPSSISDDQRLKNVWTNYP